MIHQPWLVGKSVERKMLGLRSFVTQYEATSHRTFFCIYLALGHWV
jgi:hypothetical protein